MEGVSKLGNPLLLAVSDLAILCGAVSEIGTQADNSVNATELFARVTDPKNQPGSHNQADFLLWLIKNQIRERKVSLAGYREENAFLEGILPDLIGHESSIVAQQDPLDIKNNEITVAAIASCRNELEKIRRQALKKITRVSLDQEPHSKYREYTKEALYERIELDLQGLTSSTDVRIVVLDDLIKEASTAAQVDDSTFDDQPPEITNRINFELASLDLKERTQEDTVGGYVVHNKKFRDIYFNLFQKENEGEGESSEQVIAERLQEIRSRLQIPGQIGKDNPDVN